MGAFATQRVENTSTVQPSQGYLPICLFPLAFKGGAIYDLGIGELFKDFVFVQFD